MFKYFYSLSRRFFVFFIPVAILLGSCSPKRDLVYLSDMNDPVYETLITGKTDPRVQPGDLITITVKNVDPETSNLYNNGLLPAANNAAQLGASLPVNDYLVDKDGDINFPSVGKIKLVNLTLDEATQKVTAAIAKNAKDPIVTMAYKNFKITVIGEVNKPGVFTIPNGKVNMFEALGLAGDMTGFGMRQNVWVMHEENGKRTVNRVDLNSKNILQSPLFYLQQNDVVYVTPDKLKERQARTDTRTLSIIVATATLMTVILSRLF